ncbi:hypothetical protein BDZ85DRAFT_22311 [Elsinoe ampelina]|uniref:Uncharacterized protein n=1 Tax=Elsinoe ampelina TaxID=302913 RepID=A0A6A6G5B4_9PEZI|nr:hypothetical protein BDZ85DRAFT_22311 [Elsinoe ampelina]
MMPNEQKDRDKDVARGNVRSDDQSQPQPTSPTMDQGVSNHATVTKLTNDAPNVTDTSNFQSDGAQDPASIPQDECSQPTRNTAGSGADIGPQDQQSTNLRESDSAQDGPPSSGPPSKVIAPRFLQRSPTIIRLERFLILPLEIMNTGWLLYVVFANATGGFMTCACLSRTWSRGQNAYLDFEASLFGQQAKSSFLWFESAISGGVMPGAAIVLLSLQWALQSHMNTRDLDSARRGLNRVRAWRYHTWWLPYSTYYLCDTVRIYMLWPCCRLFGYNPADGTRRVLRWTWEDDHKLVRRKTFEDAATTNR